MKLKVQAQHLQPGDTCAGGKILSIIVNSINWPSTKVFITIEDAKGLIRSAYWGKYTEINIDRPEKVEAIND